MSDMIITRQLQDVTRDIRIKTGQFLMDAIDIGRLLYEAKAMVPTGQWMQYVEQELPFSHSWANNYMRLYRELGSEQVSLFEDAQTMKNLRPTQALELLALPAQERAEFIQNHDVEAMSTRELKAAIRERDEARKALEAAIQEQDAAREAWEASVQEAEDARQEAQKKADAAEASAQETKKDYERAKARADVAEQDSARAREREAEALKNVEQLKKQLADAKTQVERAKKNPKIPEDMMAKLRQEAEQAAQEKAADELKKKLDAAEAAARKATQAREEAQADAQAARQKLEAIQKSAKLADPDLMAVQVLGQQLLQQWNVIMGHRKKAAATNQANAGPLDAFLKKLLETMSAAIDQNKEAAT